MIEKNEIVNVVRYFRGFTVSYDRFSLLPIINVKSCGGIVFNFTIFQKLNKLEVVYTICRNDENFNKKIGRCIVEERKSKNENVIIIDDYDRNQSLIENVFIHLEKIKDKNHVKLYSEMKKIYKNHKKVSELFD